MSEETGRQRQIAMLLRHLAAGLSSYRLFPGDTEQSAFVSAVDRIQEAAVQPLAAGSVVVEIRGRSFVTGEGALPEDESTYRLALACYERRVERLHIGAAPSSGELATVFEALTREVEEVAAAGGVETLLNQAGVTSIALTQFEPQAISAAVDPKTLASAQADMWEVLREERPLSVPLVEGDFSQAAAEIYGNFRDLVAALPANVAEDPELYRRLHRAMASLPGKVRRDLVAVLIEESPSEQVAARMVTSMTDHQIAQLLVELGEDGEHDAVELANELVGRRFRQTGLVELVREQTLGAASQDSPVVETRPEHEERDTVMTAISEIVGEGLTRGEDATAVSLGFPDTPDDLRVQALATLRDYLAAEEDLERLELILELWVREVQASLLDGGTETSALVGVVESVRAEIRDDDGRRTIFSEFKRRLVDTPFLQEVLGPDIHEDADRIARLLDPLGEAAVEGLLDLLGEESDRTRRSTLLSILVKLTGSYPAPLEARLVDDRWYMVRNAVSIMHKAEGGRGRVPFLLKASSHSHPAVRREVIWGLVSVLGAEAATHMPRFVTDPDVSVRERAVSFLGGLDSSEAVEVLAGVARTSDDASLRRRALEEISQSPSVDATRLLRHLSLFRSRPRLPWSLRRHARKLMRARGSST